MNVTAETIVSAETVVGDSNGSGAGGAHGGDEMPRYFRTAPTLVILFFILFYLFPRSEFGDRETEPEPEICLSQSGVKSRVG